MSRKVIVEGAWGSGWEDLILSSLRDRCDPVLEPTIYKVTIEDKPVYVVAIEESDDKPHLSKSNGVAYIRVGSTDRPATRYELDEIYRVKSPG